MDQSIHDARGPTFEPELITADEFARMLQISTRTLWRLRSTGQIIEPIKLGGSTRWRREEVCRWIEAGCPDPNAHSH